MTREKIQDAQQWVRSYFLDHPSASVDAAAREAQTCHLALHKSDISRIRREVRLTIDRHATQSPAQISQPPRRTRPTPGYQVRRNGAAVAPVVSEPFNTIRIGVSQSDPEANLTADDIAAKEAVPVGKPAVLNGTAPSLVRPPAKDEKTKFLWDYAEKHPETAPKELNKILIARFGSGFYLPTVSEALKYARAVVGLPQTRRPSKAGQAKRPPVALTPQLPTNDSVDDAIRTLAASLLRDKTSGSLTLKVEEDGTYSWTSELKRFSRGSSKV